MHCEVSLKIIDEIERLHAIVDDVALEIASAHAGRLSCRRGCHDCCVDGLTVFEVEAALIRRRAPELLAEAMPRAAGACAFLDAEGGCRIYAHRPYVCRTQGLPLRWLDVKEDGAAVELRDVCSLNTARMPPVEELPADACWLIGPIEQRLAALQRSVDGGLGRRRALRELFAR